MIVTECCICRDYKSKTNPLEWYTPKREERIENYFTRHRVSHSYCPICLLRNLEFDGYSKSELEKILNVIEQEKKA